MASPAIESVQMHKIGTRPRSAPFTEDRERLVHPARRDGPKAGRAAALDAVASLVAWDDCAFMLDLTPDAVQMLIETGDETTRHQALLLLPAVIALNT